MNSQGNSRFSISPIMVFILVLTMQFGPEYLTMSNRPIQLAGQDSWISAILCGIAFHVVIWMIYRILNRSGRDLVHIHPELFGKWAGNGLNFIFIVYFLMNACFQIRIFIEIIQVWLFPDLQTWSLALVMLLLAYYIVAGGFRVIVGICMFSLLRNITLISLFFTADFFHFRNLSPLMDHSLQVILQASKEFTFPYMGVEALFFCYSFIKNPKTSEKWAHLANLITIGYCLMNVFISLLLFKPQQLSNQIWTQLTKYKFVHFPFIERFEFIGAASQILWVIPILCFCFWASSRMLKIMLNVKQLKVLPILLISVFIAVCLIPGHSQIEVLQTNLSNIGIYIVYGYIPFVFIVGILRTKARTTP